MPAASLSWTLPWAKLWGRGKACGKFVDLGCGDGRVVLEVCKAFPDIQGLGVDLNAKLIGCAQERAKFAGLAGRAEFIVSDLGDVDLSAVAAVFLYVPPAALTHVVKHVLPSSGLQQGIPIFSADGPLRTRQVEPLVLAGCRLVRAGLHCYVWAGPRGF